MIAAEALLFGLDEALVVRVVLGDCLPVELEVALDAVGALELEVGLFDLLQEGGVLPGGAVVDGGDVGGSAHRPEVTVVLIGGDVLGLVDFEEAVGGVANDIAGGVGAEEELTGAADAEYAAVVEIIADAPAPEDVLEAGDADEGLGVEGGGGLYGGGGSAG